MQLVSQVASTIQRPVFQGQEPRGRFQQPPTSALPFAAPQFEGFLVPRNRHLNPQFRQLMSNLAAQNPAFKKAESVLWAYFQAHKKYNMQEPLDQEMHTQGVMELEGRITRAAQKQLHQAVLEEAKKAIKADPSQTEIAAFLEQSKSKQLALLEDMLKRLSYEAAGPKPEIDAEALSELLSPELATRVAKSIDHEYREFERAYHHSLKLFKNEGDDTLWAQWDTVPPTRLSSWSEARPANPSKPFDFIAHIQNIALYPQKNQAQLTGLIARVFAKQMLESPLPISRYYKASPAETDISQGVLFKEVGYWGELMENVPVEAIPEEPLYEPRYQNFEPHASIRTKSMLALAALSLLTVPGQIIAGAIAGKWFRNRDDD